MNGRSGTAIANVHMLDRDGEYEIRVVPREFNDPSRTRVVGDFYNLDFGINVDSVAGRQRVYHRRPQF